MFSGFYLAFMALLCALIFRAVAIEFRSKHPSPRWRAFWDAGFAIGSLVSTLLIGVAMGNIAWGVPLDARGEFAGSFLGLLNPVRAPDGRDDGGALRHARRHLPRAQDRGRAAGARCAGGSIR